MYFIQVNFQDRKRNEYLEFVGFLMYTIVSKVFILFTDISSRKNHNRMQLSKIVSACDMSYLKGKEEDMLVDLFRFQL